MITSRYVSVNGVTIFVETNNGPREEGVMCCFGSAGRETRQFHGMMDALEDKLEVIAFDMPGHGKSWPLEGLKCLDTPTSYCEFIIDVFKELNIENPICIGCALGGNVCFYLAQHYPVRAIVSMAGTDYSPFVSQAVIDNLDHPYASVQHTHIDFTDSLIGSNVSKENRDFILWGVMTEIGRVKRADYGGVYNGFDVREDMKKITCPALVIRGADDWSESEEMHKPVLERLSNSSHLEYQVLPGISHYNPQEDPELISNVILKFLKDAEA
ncbi:MAG: alpha/beta hydrolase [Solobacterium sp.]|nr:alpha/beta hydrolase [Solobacterium sp.]